MQHFPSPSRVVDPSDSSSPSSEGDKVSLQLWGDIILEHLHLAGDPLPSAHPVIYTHRLS
jgi:hypothetical protein